MDNIIAKPLISIVVKNIVNAIRDTLNKDVSISVDQVNENLVSHLNYTRNWAHELNVRGFASPKKTNDVNIDLSLYLMPRRYIMSRLDNIADNNTINFNDIINDNIRHTLIIGQPGSGKTTCIKSICNSMLPHADDYKSNLSIPFLIRLRELNSNQTGADVIDYILDKVGISLNVFKAIVVDSDIELTTKRIRSVKENIVAKLLDELNVMLLLDGFDEIVDKADRKYIYNQINKLSAQINNAKIIMTTRAGEFLYKFDKFDEYEIAPLDNKQRRELVERWLKTDDDINKFMLQLEGTPYNDTSVRPLTLAILCAIYERTKMIPDKPKTMYSTVLLLLLREWDQQRGFDRKTQYANFEPDRKLDYLCDMSYNITIKYKTTTFTKQQLEKIYLDKCKKYCLPPNEYVDVVNEIESHTGLLIQSGYDSYEFSHKSLQEYLCASYIIRLPSYNIIIDDIDIIPNELAISIAMASESTRYIYDIAVNVFNRRITNLNFVKAFINRMQLEKPDFENNEQLLFALLIIYTLAVKLSHADISKDINSIKWICDFEKYVMQYLSKQAAIDLNTNYYYSDIIHTNWPSGKVYKCTKINKHNNNIKKLPVHFYVHEDFIVDKMAMRRATD